MPGAIPRTVAASGARPRVAPLARAALRRADRLGVRLPVVVVLYLIAVVLPLQAELGTLLVSALRAVLLVVTGPLLVLIFLGKVGRVYATDVLLVLHIVWVLLSLAQNNPDALVEQAGSTAIELLGGYAVGRALIRSPEQFLLMCKWLTAIVLVSLPFALYETATGRPPIIDAMETWPATLFSFPVALFELLTGQSNVMGAGGGTPLFRSVEVVTVDPRMGLERVQGMFSHPIHYGLFCSVVFSLCFVGLRTALSRPGRYVRSAVIAFCVFLSLSSGALLAIALQFGLILWSRLLAAWPRRWWLLGSLAAMAYVVVDLLSNRNPLQVFMSYATFSPDTAYYRALIFEYGMQNVWANPLLGLGLNDWARPWWMHDNTVDNFWLLMAIRWGIPGLLLIAAAYGLALFRIMRIDLGRDATLQTIRQAWVFTFIGLSFTLCTVHVWTNVYSFVFFLLGAGMWLLEAKPADGPADDDVDPPARSSQLAHSRFPPVRRRMPG